MKYLLSQDEFDALESRKHLRDFRALVTRAANWVLETMVGPKCIHTPRETRSKEAYLYCGECPLGTHDGDREVQRVFCGLDKRYSK